MAYAYSDLQSHSFLSAEVEQKPEWSSSHMRRPISKPTDISTDRGHPTYTYFAAFDVINEKLSQRKSRKTFFAKSQRRQISGKKGIM